MIIGPLSASLPRRPHQVQQASAGQSPDRVELTASSPAPVSSLPLAAVAGAAVGGPAGTAVGRWADGVEFRQKRFFFFFKSIDAEQAERRAGEGKRVDLRPPGQGWLRTEGAHELEQARFFYGSAPPPDEAETAAALRNLAGRVEPFGAYRELTTSESPQVLVQLDNERKMVLQSGEEARLADYLCGGPGPQGLSQPELARGLHALQQGNFSYQGDPAELYRYGESYLSVAYRNVQLGEHDLERVPDTLKEPKELLDALAPRFPKGLQEAYDFVRQNPAPGTPEQKAETLARLGQNPLYQAVLERNQKEPGRLSELLETAHQAQRWAEGKHDRAVALWKVCQDEKLALTQEDGELLTLLGGDARAYPRLARATPEQKAVLRTLLDSPDPARGFRGDWKLVDHPTLGVAFDDSPDQSYPTEARTTLTSPPLSLQGLSHCRLSFRCDYELEQGYDQVHLEASRNGESFQTLRSFTGSSSGEAVEVDLREYDGQSLTLRWRLQADDQVEQSGFRFGQLSLRGTDAQGRVHTPLSLDSAPVSADEVVRLTLAQPDPAWLGEACRRLGDHRAAAALAKVLEGREKESDYAEQTAALTLLAEQLGVRKATELWPNLSGNWAEKAEQTVQLDQLSQLLGRPELTDELLKQGVTTDEAATLRELAGKMGDKPAGWKFEGKWGVEGPALVHPHYDNNCDSSLTTPPVELGPEAQLSFELRHELESGYDHLHVEIAPEGGKFTRLTSFTGSSGWRDHRLDLSAYASQTVRVRFRLTADDQSSSDGVALRALKLGELSFDRGQGTLEQLAELARQGDAAQIARVDRLAVERGPAAALTLSAALGPTEDEARLSELASRVGVDRAVKLWPQVKSFQPSVVEDRLTECSRLLDLTGSQGSAESLATKLLQAGVEARALVDFLDRPPARPDFVADQGWQALPGGGYKRGYQGTTDSSLTTPALHLGQNSLLVLEHSYGLESGYDHVFLQARRDGGEWTTLKTWTGQADDQRELIDLSAFDGGTVQLRLRLQADDQGHEWGYHLQGMRVSSHSGPVFGFNTEKLAAEELVDRLVAVGPTGLSDELSKLEQLEQDLGSPSAALKLWPQTADPSDVKNLGELGRNLGTRAAGALFTPGQPAGPALEAFRASGRLAAEAGQALDLGTQLERARKLVSANLSEPERAALRALVGREDDLAGWKLDQGWQTRFVEGSGYGLGFPSYPADCKASATTPTLDLTGLTGARLRLRLGGSLESGYDSLCLEARRPGGQWQSLASFTGSQVPEQEHQLDLSTFDGGKLELRLRMQADDQGSDVGPQLRQMLVTGWRAQQPEVALRLDSGPRTMLSLVDQFDRLQPAERSARLQATAILAERLGSSSAALEVSGWLKSPDQLEPAALLARSLGVAQARSLWPSVVAAADPLQAASRASLLSEQAATLEVKLGLEPSEKERTAFVTALLEQPCGAPQFARLTELLDMTGKLPEGLRLNDWVRRADGILSDNDGSGYQTNANSSLLLGPVQDAATLTMELAYDLEDGYDTLKLEARQGEEWVELDSLNGSAGFATRSWDVRGQGLSSAPQLRLRLTSDDQVNQAGVRIRSLQLGSLAYEAARPTLADLSGALVCPQEKLRDRMDLITRLTVATGNLSAGLKGARLLEPLEGSKELNQSVEALVLLTQRLGLSAASELWPALAANGANLSPLVRVDLASRLELVSRRWTPEARAEDLSSLLAEVLAEASRPEGKVDRLLKSLEVLLPEDGARVVGFLQEHRAPGGRLAHLTLAQAMDDFMAVIGTRVLSDSLEGVLEQMLARQGRTVEERDESLIVGGVVVRKKEHDQGAAP